MFSFQAFSTTELASAKSRLRQLQSFQSQVDSTWRSMRWLMDVLNFARDKQSSGGVFLSRVLVDRSGSESPIDSPRHSNNSQTLLQVPTEMSGFPNPSSISIKITSSGSSFSLTDSGLEQTEVVNTEMRRCASTSGLMLAATSSEDINVSADYVSKSSPCTLKLIDDSCKSLSTDNLSLTYKVDSSSGSKYDASSASVTPVNEEVTEKCQDDDDTLSQDGIVINVVANSGSSHSLSANEADEGDEAATNLDIEEFDDDISGYKEQEIDALLHLPHDDSREHPSDDEDSLTDCGIQFKVSSANEDQSSDEEEDDYAYIASILDSEQTCEERDEECPLDVLKISVAYTENVPPDTCVRLQLHPDATAREILEAVVAQVNEAVLEGEQNSEAYVNEQVLNDLTLVVSFNASERCLSDSFQPLKVQNPWTKGKLLAKKRTEECTSSNE